jgi:hypothetical protein
LFAEEQTVVRQAAGIAAETKEEKKETKKLIFLSRAKF